MNLLRRLRTLFRRRDVEAEMAEEMRFHLEQRTADLAADGLSADEAHFAAQRRFGNIASIQEHAREAHGWGWLDRILTDLRFAVRQLAKSPGFSLLAIATLALGIGANTAMFNVANSMLLRPLPFDPAGRLDRFFRATAQNQEGQFSAADVRDLMQAGAPYGEIAPYEAGEASLSEPGQPPEMAVAYRVPASFFPLLKTTLQLGRNFRPGEAVPGNDRVVILSHRLWQNRLGGRTDILGHALRIDGETHLVIGVLPASFDDWRYLGAVDLFRPLALEPAQWADRQSTPLRILALPSNRPDRGTAVTLITGIGGRLAAAHPEVNAGSTWRVISLHRLIAGKNGPAVLGMLIGLSGFVLLIGCSNLANLLLVRTITQAREFAVRSALGASRLQLLRPLVAESLLLALAGGLCALLVAMWVGDWLSIRSTGDNGEQVPFVIDWLVFSWTLGVSLVTALAFGLAPALFALRLDLNQTLKSGGRGATGARGQQRFRQILIVGQFALAMVLLTGAAVFIRGLDEINHRRAGWESSQLITGSVLLPVAKYANADRIDAFHRLVVERLHELPGVASASVSAFTPFFSWPENRRFFVEGRPLPEPGHEPGTTLNTVSPRYFTTVGTRIMAGRAFDTRDTASSGRVFIVNQTLARALFDEANPLGHRIRLGGDGPPAWGEIVGVARDVVSVMPESNPVTFQLYQPMAQDPHARCELSVRTAGPLAADLLPGIRAAVAGLDPDLPIRNLKTADDAVVRANYQLAVLRDLLTSLGLLGLSLASLGIYGVIARAMAQRAGEFAIRLALGASVADITGLVLVNGVKLALIGSVAGLAGAFGVTRLLAAGFPGMHLHSGPVLAGTTLLLIAVALLACWLPARRAGQVDAMTVLRAE